jgi:AraC-like DNA-binding protein
MALADFIGQELVSGLARLDASRLMGSWEGGSPSAMRKRARFSQLLYHENDMHPHHEFCHLISGRCCLSFKHQTSELEPDDVVVLASGVHHAETICKTNVGYRLAWWVLNDVDPMLHVRRYRGVKGYDVEYVVRLNSLSTYGKERIDVLRELAAQSATQRPPIEALREAMLSVAIELYRQILKGGETPFDARAELARKITDFVRIHSGQPLSLADVAKAVHMSPNYITSLYHSQTGVSLGRFIKAERIGLAQRLLRQPDSSVKSVGLGLGFSDPFTFSRAFKRITGTAPCTWKRTQGVLNASGR